MNLQEIKEELEIRFKDLDRELFRIEDRAAEMGCQPHQVLNTLGEVMNIPIIIAQSQILIALKDIELNGA